MDFLRELDTILEEKNRIVDPERPDLIEAVKKNKEAFVSENGALATWTPVDSTGRSPKDTLIVKRPEVTHLIDWDSPNNLPLDPETFDMICRDALDMAKKKKTFYITDRVVGADSGYALPVRTITDRAVTALFTATMFRPVPSDLCAASMQTNLSPWSPCRRFAWTKRSIPAGCASCPTAPRPTWSC